MSSLFAVIVEDDCDASEIFTRALNAIGFTTERIGSGDKALQRLAVALPDLVVLDLYLPGTSGVEVLRQIRADPLLAQTRVVVTTAYPEALAGVESEADIVLVKPVSFSQLRSAVMGLQYPR